MFSRLLVLSFAALVTGSQNWTLEPFSNMGAGDKVDVKIGECPTPLCLLKLCGLQAVGCGLLRTAVTMTQLKS